MAPALADPASSRASRRWSDLRLRALSAAILAPIALICVWFGSAAFFALMGAATVGLVVEWVQLWREARNGRGRQAGAEAASRFPIAPPPVALLALGLLIILAAAGSLAWLRADPIAGLANILFLLCLVWCSDTGAYAVGRLVGGPKLAPQISPGKTVSGAAGGLAGAVLAGICVALAAPGPTSLWHAGGVAVVLGMVAQGGDLLESYVKRRLGAKDSGRLIPGHGGLLDRLDALLAVALAAASLALAQGRGVVLWG